MKRYLKFFALLGILICLNACDQQQHPTGNPRQDAEMLNQMMNRGDLQGASQFMDEVLWVYVQQYSITEREAYEKIDEFWEWHAKLQN